MFADTVLQCNMGVTIASMHVFSLLKNYLQGKWVMLFRTSYRAAIVRKIDRK